MPDNADTSYIAAFNQRQEQDRQDLIQQLQAATPPAPPAAPGKAPTQPPSAPPEQSPVHAAATNSVSDALSHLGDLLVKEPLRAAVHGGAKLLDSVNGLAEDAVNAVAPGLNFHPTAKSFDAWASNTVNQPSTVGGKLDEGLIQWGLPFASTLRAMKATFAAKSLLGQFGQAMGAGAAADATAFDPSQGRFTDLLNQLADGHPTVKAFLPQFLASQPGDSHWQSRLKNVLEGAGLGVGAETIAKLIGAGAHLMVAQGKNPQELLKPAAEAAPGTGPIDYTPTKPGDVKTASPVDLRLVNPEDVKPLDYTPPPHNINVPEHWKLVDQEVAKQATSPEKSLHVPYVDHQSGSVVFAKEPPTPAAIPMDQQVKAIEGKAPHTLTAEDLVTLRAYRQLQEAAFPGIVKPGEQGVAKEAASLVDASGAPLKASEAPTPRQAANVAPEAPTQATEASAPKAFAEGETVYYGDGGDSGQVIKNVAGGKVLVKDDITGAHRVVTPNHVPGEYADVVANEAAINTALGRQQSGFISPTVLTHMATSLTGGAAGYASAPDDASMAERLTRAGLGALAGLTVSAGAYKLFGKSPAEALKNPEVASLVRPEVRNLAPIEWVKQAPIIRKDKAEQLVRDLAAGTPPTASKDAFNFDRISTTEDVKDLLNATYATFEKEWNKAKGSPTGSLSLEDIKSMAAMVGGSPETISQMYKDTANASVRFLANRQALVAANEHLADLIRNIQMNPGDDMAILAARNQALTVAKMNALLGGTQTEVARTLSAMRITARSSDLIHDNVQLLMDAIGGHDANKEFLQELDNILTPQGKAQALQMGTVARTRAFLKESIIAGKLWSPVTHMANIAGNVITALGADVERAGAVGVAGVRKLLNPAAAEASVTLGEAKALMYGQYQGLIDALRITNQGAGALRDAGAATLKGDFEGAANIMRQNASEFGGAWQELAAGSRPGAATLRRTAEGVNEAALSAKALGLDPDSLTGKTVDFLSGTMRLPFRALGAADEVFWSLNYRGELHAQAYRQATREGLEGADLANRVAQLTAVPTMDARVAAMKAAEDGTFTAPLEGWQKHFQDAVDGANVGPIPVGRLVVPFVKTPANMLNYVARRNPVTGMLLQSFKDDLRSADPAVRDLAVSRVATGTTLLSLGALLAGGIGDVSLTGGGDLKTTSERIAGWQPYSVKVGDTYFAYNRMDPLGMFLGLSADFRDILTHLDEKSASDSLNASVLALSRNLSSKSYLAGLSQLVQALSDMAGGRDGAMSQWVDKTVAGAVPMSSLFNTVRKQDDPAFKEVWSLVDALKAELPGYSKDVPNQVNIFGEPMHYPPGLGPDVLSPIATSVASSEPAAKELARLNIDLQKPPRTIMSYNGSPGVTLTPQQYVRMMTIAGQWFKPALHQLVTSEGYQKLSDSQRAPDANYRGSKETAIRMLYSQARQYGQQMLLAEDPSVLQAFQQDRRNVGNALFGNPIVQSQDGGEGAQ